MFPIWPIVNVEEIIAALYHDEDDLGSYALATAVVAATMAQLKLVSAAKGMTADVLEAECQRVRSLYKYREQTNLTTLRTAFFLHVYHENQEKGGGASSLYLRESISIAQIMGLHREVFYKNLSFQEQQLHRRVFWLLFITERGVCILHKLPVILNIADVSLPDIDTYDVSHVLPAFLNLVNLFWTFDQSGMFEILRDEGIEDSSFLNDLPSLNGNLFHQLQTKLEKDPLGSAAISDVQKADIWVTRQWMRTLLWKVATRRGLLALTGSDQTISPSFPVTVAQEFLTSTSGLPISAMEAHGLGMQLKIYEIASSVADSVSSAFLPRAPSYRPADILSRLHQILSSFRGGNKTLVDMLCKKMVHAHQYGIIAIPASAPGPGSPAEPLFSRIFDMTDSQERYRSSAIFHDSEIDALETIGFQELSVQPYSTTSQDSFVSRKENFSLETSAQDNHQTQDLEWLQPDMNQNFAPLDSSGVWALDLLDQSNQDHRQTPSFTMPG